MSAHTYEPMTDPEAASAFLSELRHEARKRARVPYVYRLSATTRLRVTYIPPQYAKDLPHSIPPLLFVYETWSRFAYNVAPRWVMATYRGWRHVSEVDALRLLCGEPETAKETADAILGRAAQNNRHAAPSAEAHGSQDVLR